MTNSTTERELWRQIFVHVSKHGKITAPRDREIIEIENYHYELPPYVRFCSLKPRQLKLDYIKQETRWFLRGNPYDLTIGNYSNIWRNVVVDGKLNSNYGYSWFTLGGMQFVIEQLMQDKDSRRASVVIVDRSHLDLKQKDVPCTAYLNFRIREDRLNMSVHMRSQDAVYGMGNDAPAFSFFQEMIYVWLKPFYKELEMGTYHHTADSFHVYQRHYEMLTALTDPNVEFEQVEFPRISSHNEVEYLLNTYNIGRQSLTQPLPLPTDEMLFAKWLETN